MFHRFRPALIRAAIRLTRRATGLTPIDDHQPDDVFVVGFPKSGNTWMQYLLAGLIGGIDARRCPDALVQELVPDSQARVAYQRFTEPVFFKSHDLPRPAYRRVIYLLRDGRDAMVSYFHHHNAVSSPVDFVTLVRTAPGLASHWHEHVEAWLANPYGAELLVIRYEDLKRDCVGELTRVCAFLRRPADQEQLALIAEAASFGRMKERELAKGWSNPRWPKDKAFVRRGAVGSFRDEMPAEALALLLAEAGPTLKKLGYLN